MIRLEMLSQISQITDYLYLSGFIGSNIDKLSELKITCIIDATNIPSRPPSNFEHLKISVNDEESARLDVHFDTVADKIRSVKENGGKVLVHCAAGISRSSTLVIAYLMKHENMTLTEAYRFTVEKRRIISPNNGFWRQLIDYERKLFSSNTVKMVQTRYRSVPDCYL